MSSPPRPDLPWTLAVGARRGRYEVIAPLGRGGAGEVYAVEHERGGRFAMKLVAGHKQGDRRAADRAVLEAKLVKDLDHVNVVRYKDAFIDDDGAVVLVTELLQGHPLRALIATSALGVERALSLGRQLADAAAAVHGVGAVHRDIKPENVFVVPGDTVKLFDFGLAKTAAVSLDTLQPVGTPRYVAPDQLAGSGRAAAAPDPRWDIYAIGLVVFEMLAGVHPFDIDRTRAPKSPGDVVERHLAGSLPRLDAVVTAAPPALVETIARAVARDPARRTPTAALLSAELAAARRAWLHERGDGGHRITDEVRQLKLAAQPRVDPPPPAGDDPAPDSLDGPTLERPRSAAEVRPRRGRFGTEEMLPYVDADALRRATEKKNKP
jgi:serine/threonine-protein kinase